MAIDSSLTTSSQKTSLARHLHPPQVFQQQSTALILEMIARADVLIGMKVQNTAGFI